MRYFFSHLDKLLKGKRPILSRIISLVIIIALITTSTPSVATTFNDPLVDAADLGDTEQVRSLIKSGIQPDSKGDFGTTALMRAAFRGNVEIIQLLIESGAYVNAADVGGETALHLAAQNGNVEAVKALVYYGAYVDIPDKEQWTPLMRATLAKHPDVVKALLDKGADITALNSINESVLVHAAIAGVPEIAAMITGNAKAKKITKEQQSKAVDMAKRKKHDNVEKILSSFTATQDLLPTPPLDDKTPVAPASSLLNNNIKADNAPAAPKYPPVAMPPAPAATLPTPTSMQAPVAPSANNSNVLDQLAATPAEMPRTGPAKPIESAPKPTPLIAQTASYETNGVFFVQLGNFSDTNSAEAVWNNILSVSKDELGKLSPIIVKAPLSNKPDDFTYRLRAGTLSTRKNADDLCKSMRGKGISCVVVEITSPSTTSSNEAPKPQLQAAPKVDNKPADYLVPVTPIPAPENANPAPTSADLKNTAPVASAVISEKPAQTNTQPVTLLPSEKMALQASAPVRNASPSMPSSAFAGSYPKLAADAFGSGPIDIDMPTLAATAPASNVPSYTPPSYTKSATAAAEEPASPLPSPKPDESAVQKMESAQAQTTPQPSNWVEPKDEAVKTEAIAPATNKPGVDYSYPTDKALAKNYPTLTAAPTPPAMPKPESAKTAPATPTQPAAPTSMPSNNDFVANKDQVRDDVQESIREEFFKKQGVTPPARKKKEYDDFYKQMENSQSDTPVSEAVLVPDETYFSGGKSGSNKASVWLNITNLPSEAFANDYATRMFKRDTSLGNIQVIIKKGKNVSMRVGPVDSSKADTLCGAVIAGGFSCAADGNAPSASTKSSPNNAPKPVTMEGDEPRPETSLNSNQITDHWINLGTFATTSEAEYYWMFIKEDNGDLLNSLQYNLEKASKNGELGNGAVQLRTGPFPAKQRAAQLCNIMKYRNIACLVTE